LKEVAEVSRTVRKYLTELEQVNPVSDVEMVFTKPRCHLDDQG
jgi:hypothetical protein